MTRISERQRARFYINKKGKHCQMFIYIYKKQVTFQKSRQSASRITPKKTYTLRYGIFMILLKMKCIYYQKHDTLHFGTFLNTKK